MGRLGMPVFVLVAALGAWGERPREPQPPQPHEPAHASGTRPRRLRPPSHPVIPPLASLLGEQGSVSMRRMERGSYVSFDREMKHDARAPSFRRRALELSRSTRGRRA